MLAVNRLIAEYCGISEEKFQELLRYLKLVILRDDIREKELLLTGEIF